MAEKKSTGQTLCPEIHKPFRTSSEKIYTPHGNNTEENTYGYDVNEYGQKILVKTGTKNTYEEIQSWKEETSIEHILTRLAQGDNSVIRPMGSFGDISEMPKSLIEAKRQIAKLENVWNELPLEVRNKYGNSIDRWEAEMGQDSWLINMGYVKPKSANDLIEDTKPDVPKTEPTDTK